MKLVKKLMLTSLIMVFFVSTTMVSLTWAPPVTYIWVNPPVIEDTSDGKCLVRIDVAAAPPTFAWAVSLSWDPDRLELFYIKEGSFLKNAHPMTAMVFTPFVDANPIGEITISGSIVGNPDVVPWASGDGWLCSLGFIAQAQGAAHLDLFDTRLYDHTVGVPPVPVPTDYPNEDGLVKATGFYFAGLDNWGLKVNGKAGISKGGGITTPVGTPNLFEAYVTNTGDFATDVTALFEIRGPLGKWIATIPVNYGNMDPGTTTIISYSWTAEDAKVYRISACVLYTALGLTLEDGLSKTLRLAAIA